MANRGVSTRLWARCSVLLVTLFAIACTSAAHESSDVVSIVGVTPSAVTVIVGGHTSVAVSGTTRNGQVIDLTSRVTAWSSSDDTVAAVSGGEVTGKMAGSAVITAAVQVGFSTLTGEVTVTVSGAQVVSLTVAPESPMVKVGASVPLTVTARYSDRGSRDVSADATWSSKAPDVATVDGATLRGVAAGSAEITATVSGVSASITAHVTECTVIANCTSERCTTSTDQTCNACASGFFLSGNACIPCSGACGVGKFQSAACSATADRACATCTAIDHCSSETCSTDSDQQCSACGASYYLSVNACVPCSGACPAGQSQSAACTATSDRACTSCAVIANCTSETCTTPAAPVCHACAGGFFLQGNACVPCSGACGAGQYQSAACSANADRVCSTCTSVPHCTNATCTNGADQVCNTCSGGYYASGGTCHACSGACGAAQYQSAACSATADRVCSSCASVANCTTRSCTTATNQVCSACDAAYYVSGGTCAACSGACASGQYQSAACSANADRQCTTCTPIANCQTETCTTSANQTCTACNATYFVSGGLCASCSGACPAGSYQTAACSTNADRACGMCTPIANCASESCTNATNQTCLACNAGYYSGGASCNACPTHCASCTGAAACTTCDPGFYGPTCSSFAAPDCYAILVNGGSSGDGLYTIAPDGANPVQVYCDMTAGGWTLVNDHDTALGYASGATWRAGIAGTPNGGHWGILNRAGEFKSAATRGDYEFRMTYGQTQNAFTQWRQTGDPTQLDSRGLVSSVAMFPANQAGCGAFAGETNDSADPVLSGFDGDVGSCYWFPIGTSAPYGGGIPAYNSSVAGGLITDRLRFWARMNAPVTPAGAAERYPFDEGAGTTFANAIGTGNDGVIGSATWSGACHAGSCLSFNGSQYAHAANDVSLNVGTGDFSVSAWVRTADNTGERVVAATNTCFVGEGWILGVVNGQPGFALFGGGGIGYLYGPSSIADNAWHFIAGVRKGTSATLYVDGAPVTTGTLGAGYNVNSANADLQVGNLNTCPRGFNGSIDDLRFYRAGLTRTDIATLLSE